MNGCRCSGRFARVSWFEYLVVGKSLFCPTTPIYYLSLSLYNFHIFSTLVFIRFAKTNSVCFLSLSRIRVYVLFSHLLYFSFQTLCFLFTFLFLSLSRCLYVLVQRNDEWSFLSNTFVFFFHLLSLFARVSLSLSSLAGRFTN